MPRRVVLAVAAVLALVVGVGTAFALLRSGGAGRASSSTDATGAGLDPQQHVGEIQGVLLQFEEDVVKGDFAGAWALTSQRFQTKKLAEQGGYGQWVTDMQSLRPYLQPAGLHVTIVSWDAANLTATIDATGMRWTKPGAPCTYWQGVTWVVYVKGQWYSEPGYSLTSERRAEWQPRAAETLGTACGE